MMKQIAGILVLFIALAGLSGVAQAQTNVLYSGSGDPVDCPVASDGSIGSIEVNDGLRSNAARCVTDLEKFKIDLYKIGICRSAPDTTNPANDWESKCAFIFDRDTALEVEVTTASSVDIATYVDLSVLTAGTYTHAVLMIGNTLYAQMKKQFADSFVGRSGYGTGAGSFCYSIDGASYAGNAPAIADLAVRCVDSEATMNSIGDFGYMAKTQVNFNGSTSKTAGDGAMVYLMADETTIATISPATTTRLAGVIAFSTSKVIDAGIASVNLGFQLTDQGQVQFSTRSACADASRASGTEACINAMRNYGVGFRFTVQ